MAEEQFQERTEQPTPKRKKDAREKGQVPRSRELNTMAVTLAGALSVMLLGGTMVTDIAEVMRAGLSLERAEALTTGPMLGMLGESVLATFLALLPWLGLLAAVAAVAPVSLGGWSFSTKALAFKADRINPIAGLKRLFSARGLVELLKALAKFLAVGLVAVIVLQWQADQLLQLGRESMPAALGHAAWLMAISFLMFCTALMLIAALDVPFQIWDHNKKLRMTRQEVKDDHKETEGRPEVRSRVRALQFEMSRRRMMEDIPIASVVVTNPTHYAVALRYEADEMSAPVVVAKGVDHLAMQIRTAATEHGVPLFEAPALARALYAGAEIGDEIDERLYVAVAQVLTYIYQLDTFLAGRGTRPTLPDIEFDDAEDFEA